MAGKRKGQRMLGEIQRLKAMGFKKKALALQKGRLDAGMPLLSQGDLAKLLTLWRASDAYGFLWLLARSIRNSGRSSSWTGRFGTG
ncbi:MAG: hypothetical protein ACYCYP_10595 [Leptospirales bacterium]